MKSRTSFKTFKRASEYDGVLGRELRIQELANLKPILQIEQWISGKAAHKCAGAVASTVLSSLLLTVPFMMAHALLPATEYVTFNF
jgi:hypothetical protein